MGYREADRCSKNTLILDIALECCDAVVVSVVGRVGSFKRHRFACLGSHL